MATDDKDKKIKKGALVLCPRKKHVIGKLKKEKKADELLMLSRIKFEKEQERVQGTTPTCKLCGSLYYVQGKLYTSEGWLPDEPNLEPVSLTRR